MVNNPKIRMLLMLLFFFCWSFNQAVYAQLVETTKKDEGCTPSDDDQPNYENGIAIDGSSSEWNLANDFFANMYRAGKADKKIESKLYLRYDCKNLKLYVLVLAQPGVLVLDNKPEDAFVKINLGDGPPPSDKLVDGNSGASVFKWIYNNDNKAIGWEASIASFPPGVTVPFTKDYNSLNVHTQVNDCEGEDKKDNCSQTSAVADRAICLRVHCEACKDPDALFTAAAVCVGNETFFDDQSSNVEANATYLWDFGDGNTSNTKGDVSHTYASAGEYTVKLKITQGDCKDEYSLKVKVHPLPQVTLASFEAVCSDVAMFTLTGGAPSGGTYSGPGVSNGKFDPTTAGVGTHEITYTYIDQNGCSNTAKANIVVKKCIKNLNLTSLCSFDPTDTRVWRVRNPNNFDVKVCWRVVGTNPLQTGCFFAPPGDSFFSTDAVGGPNTTIIDWFDDEGNKVGSNTKASGGEKCKICDKENLEIAYRLYNAKSDPEAHDGNDNHSIWIQNFFCNGTNAIFTFDENNPGYLFFFTNGTVELKGNAVVTSGGDCGNKNYNGTKWYVNVVFEPLEGASPKLELKAGKQPTSITDLWKYYKLVYGNMHEIAGLGFATFTHMPANLEFGFQVGFTANGKNLNFGASGWFNTDASLTGGPREKVPGQGDFNLDLKPECDTDLAIEKKCVEWAFVGSELTYTLIVTNNGPSAANGVEVKDYLPEGVAYISDDKGGVYDAGTHTVTWNFAGLAFPGSITIEVKVKVEEPGKLLNEASVYIKSPKDTKSENNKIDCETNACTKLACEEVVGGSGDKDDWISKVTLKGLGIGDANFSFDRVNFVPVTGWRPNSDGIGVMSEKEQGDDPLRFKEINYIAEKNKSEVLCIDLGTSCRDANNFVGVDVLLSRFYTYEGGNNAETGHWIALDEDWNVLDYDNFIADENINDGGPGHFKLHIRTKKCQAIRYLKFCAGPYADATASTLNRELPADNSDYLVRKLIPICETDLAISKRCVEKARTGEEITYYIEVKNNGEHTAKNVLVKDILPTGVTFVSADNGGVYAAGPHTVTWNLSDLAYPGSITLKVVVTAAEPGEYLNKVGVDADNDCKHDNNRDKCKTEVRRGCDVECYQVIGGDDEPYKDGGDSGNWTTVTLSAKSLNSSSFDPVGPANFIKDADSYGPGSGGVGVPNPEYDDGKGTQSRFHEINYVPIDGGKSEALRVEFCRKMKSAKVTVSRLYTMENGKSEVGYWIAYCKEGDDLVQVGTGEFIGEKPCCNLASNGQLEFFIQTEKPFDVVEFWAGPYQLAAKSMLPKDDSDYFLNQIIPCEEPKVCGEQTCSSVVEASLYQGKRKNGTAVLVNRSDANEALNAEKSDVNNEPADINFVSLGFGGCLVLKFDHPLANGSGYDFAVFETSYGNPSFANYPEQAAVFVSEDGVNWSFVGKTQPYTASSRPRNADNKRDKLGSKFDLSDGKDDTGKCYVLDCINYAKIVDCSIKSSSRFPGSADGFDVDGVVCRNRDQKAKSEEALADSDEISEISLGIGAIYPNPVQQRLVVDFAEEGEFALPESGKTRIILYNSLGREVYNEEHTLNEAQLHIDINAQHLSKGIYVMKVISDNTIRTTRIIKE